VSPEERAQMFDEYNEEQLKQDKFEEGLKKGIKEGAEKNTEKMAKEMLRKKMEISLISEITELPHEVITQWQA